MTVDKKLFKGNLYICETIPYVIEDDVTDVGYVFVSQDSFNGYKELNPTLNKLYPYNYRAINVGTTNKELYEALTVAISTETNAPVQSVMYSKGLCDNPNYMTIAECRAVTNEQIAGAFDGNEQITEFMEFKYFTSVTDTGEYTFRNTFNLKKIHFPLSCTIINKGCFVLTNANFKAGKRMSLEIVEGVENVEYLGVSAFQFNDKIKRFNFTSKLKHIGKNCFVINRPTPETYSMPCAYETFGDLSGVIEAEGSAFGGVNTNNNIKLNLTSLGGQIVGILFVTSDFDVELDWDNVTYIDNEAFRNNRITNVPILPNLTSVETAKYGMQFSTNPNLQYFGGAPKLTRISRYMFSDCFALKGVGDLGEVTQIDSAAFSDCPLLSAKFPKVTTVASGAFELGYQSSKDNEVYRTIEFGKPYAEITFGADAFKGCSKCYIYCNGVELTDEQYTALGATKPAFS